MDLQSNKRPHDTQSGRSRSERSSATDGAWYHFAGVKSGGQAHIYINGVLEASVSTAGAAANGADMTAGAIHQTGTGNVDASDGLVDDLRIYDHALSQSEIASAINAVPEPSTVALTLAGLALLAVRRIR